MNTYEHSVSLDVSRCTGCTMCLKRCPTEAIRIKDGHAIINPDRCIDCGVCIRYCPNNAKKATYSKLDAVMKYKWKIALPAPTLYGQFDELDDIDYVLQGLLDIGFDDVVEVAQAAELVSAYTRLYLKNESVIKPVISSACPVVLRLISLRYPMLKEHIMQMLPPMEIAARMARDKAKREHPEFSDEDICVCFISPCPAKVSYVKNGFGEYKSEVDEVLSISDIYFNLINVMRRGRTPTPISHSGMIGIGWATSGGECSAIFNDKYLAADGIENVNRVLDQLENGNISTLEFIELNACPGGCVGGVMALENPFVAKARLQTLRRYLPVSQNYLSEDEKEYIPEHYFFENMPTYRPIQRLSENFAESLRMMADIQKLRDVLPGIDCGACGAPTCRAFAEDVVRGNVKRDGCPVEKSKRLDEQGKKEEEI
ncbi:MAG: 4Fe-4S dicluster domain-containing protein [Ruminococcaceae bacterium]|nr:4Fe-4S dicluster domain-containing protein [Oscillospiraceae bacterium]MBQ7392569.1 4Fe-4S binding protein [Clostridia bacterium]